MKKLPSTLPNMILSLGVICLLIGGILALVNQGTAPTIAKAETQAKVDAIKLVVPAFDNNPFEERQEVSLDTEPRSMVVYPATQGGNLVGYAIETYSDLGYGGLIELMVGFDMETKVVGFSVLKHSETPGLGAKMAEWFTSTPTNSALIRDMRGVNMQQNSPLQVSKDGGKVDAITAATITSRAFLDAIERAYRVYRSLQDDSAEYSDANDIVSDNPLPSISAIDSLFSQVMPDCRLVSKAQQGELNGVPWIAQEFGVKNMTEVAGLTVVTIKPTPSDHKPQPILACFDLDGKLVEFAFVDEANNARYLVPIRQYYGRDSKRAVSKHSLLYKKWSKSQLKLKEDGGQMDAISGATNSTRTFLEALGQAIDVYQEVSSQLQANH